MTARETLVGAKHGCRIDAPCAERRHEAARNPEHPEQRHAAENHPRIVGSNPVEEGRDQASEKERDRRSDHGAECDHAHGIVENHAHDVDQLRAQGDPNPHLARPLAHRVREDAIYANDGNGHGKHDQEVRARRVPQLSYNRRVFDMRRPDRQRIISRRWP